MEESESQVKFIFRQVEQKLQNTENRTERVWLHGQRASIQEIKSHRKRKKENGRQKSPQGKMQDNFPELKDTEPPD